MCCSLLVVCVGAVGAVGAGTGWGTGRPTILPNITPCALTLFSAAELVWNVNSMNLQAFTCSCQPTTRINKCLIMMITEMDSSGCLDEVENEGKRARLCCRDHITAVVLRPALLMQVRRWNHVDCTASRFMLHGHTPGNDAVTKYFRSVAGMAPSSRTLSLLLL